MYFYDFGYGSYEESEYVPLCPRCEGVVLAWAEAEVATEEVAA